MTERVSYVGDDSLLRWYADNGADWFTEARFEDRELVLLRWQEVVNGVAYEALIDRVPEVDTLRLVVDVQPILPDPGVLGPVGHTRCSLTRRLRVGTDAPRHSVVAFTQAGAFYVVGVCPADTGSIRSRIGIGTAFFTDPQKSGDRARALVRQIIETAAGIAAGKQTGRKPVSIDDLHAKNTSPAVYTGCGTWPWR